MPTTVTKVIGTGGDYTTIQAWEDALPADLVAGDTLQIGECKNQTFSESVTISGQTTDATRYVHLRCQSGASFMDNANVRTNALRYNTANGMAVEGNPALTIGTNFTRVTGVQARQVSYAKAIDIASGVTNVLLDSCIGKDGAGGTNLAVFSLGDSTSNVYVNCLAEATAGGNDFGFEGRGQCYGCTAVAGASNTRSAFRSSYNLMVVKNCAGFGFASFANGTTAAGSDYNATDDSSASTGTHNVTSLVFADQFVSTSNDFRAVSTGGLKAGTPDSINTPDDISGLTRDAVTPWIGAWEVAPVVAVAVPTFYIETGDVVFRVAR